MADVLMVLSTIHYARAEYETARAEAEHALAIFDDMGGQADVADARLLVGHALEGLGDLTTAHKTYEKTLSEELAVGDEAGALDARAGLARCLLAQEDVDGALAQIELTITWLTNNGLSGIDQPFDLYLTAYRVLQSAARAETAQKVLAEAHTLLHDRAAQIADDDLRQSFLENVSQNKAIVREWGK
jgi:tetratricopeptide (TPR) repeat protein